MWRDSVTAEDREEGASPVVACFRMRKRASPSIAWRTTFELFSGEHRQTPHRDTVPMLVSTTVHLLVFCAIIAVPLLYINSEYPQGPDMLAFVAAAPAPPPPAPPPPAGGAKSTAARPVPTS